MKLVNSVITFHFCLVRNFFILSLERFLVMLLMSTDVDANQAWAKASSHDILRLSEGSTHSYKSAWMDLYDVCKGREVPDVFAEQRANEILCLVGDLLKALLIKLPLRCCHESQSLCVTFTLEWRFTAQPTRGQNQIQIKCNGIIHHKGATSAWQCWAHRM